MDQATGVLTLEEFLLARYDEGEAVAQRAAKAYQHVLGIPYYFDPLPGQHSGMVGMTPRAALADLEVKREIVEDAQRAQRSIEQRGPSNPPTTSAIDGHVIALRSVVRRLAAIYADHPDFRPEWRP